MNYLFGQVSGDALTVEPAMRAMLIVFVTTTLLGLVIYLAARRLEPAKRLQIEHLRRLGGWMLSVGLTALAVSWFFYEGALFTRRFFLYLMLFAVYAVVLYALYYKYTRYAELDRMERAEQERRRTYVPAPHTLTTRRTTARTRVSGRGGKRGTQS